jgi:hypothetical protein
MATEIPIVRNFQACLEVVIDEDGRGVTLRTLIHAIVRLEGEGFPCVRDEMALYALLTNGRGEHDFKVVLTWFDMGREYQVGTIGPVRIDLGQDPIAVLGLPIPLRNVVFQRPGQYSFHLLCDGQPLADSKITVR